MALHFASKLHRILLLCSGIFAVSGFTLDDFFRAPSIKPDLFDIAEKQTDQILKIKMNIGDEDGPQMAVSDILVGLHHEPANYEHTTLPGADGRHYKLSSGHRRLDVIAEGQYVSMLGTQHVRMNKACWEMCWRKDKPAGTLICGVELPHEYRRNEAALPQGEIFLSFPLWTKAGLKIGQVEKQKIEVKLQKFLEERDEALIKFEETENPVLKAIHIQNAFAALDRYNSVDHQTMEAIPMDHQVLTIQEDLLLAIKGLVWSKDPAGGHLLLGHADVSFASQQSDIVGSSRLMP